MSLAETEEAWVLNVYRTKSLNLGWVLRGLVCTIRRELGHIMDLSREHCERVQVN